MLAGQTGLKLLDLFLDFLFAVACGKEDVVGIGHAFPPFSVAIIPEGCVVFFISLHDGGEFVVGFRASQFKHDFVLAEVFFAEDAERFQALQASQGDVKASVKEVESLVEMDFGGERAARVLTHSALA